MSLLAKLTGGRPMKVGVELLYDHIGHETIHLCVDKFGRRWMAAGAWSWFRVPYKPPGIPLDGLPPEVRADIEKRLHEIENP